MIYRNTVILIFSNTDDGFFGGLMGKHSKVSRDARVSVLLETYGKLLTDVQHESVDYYYNQDLSLAEIADIVKKSRQGVHDAIRRAVVILNNYDESLKLIDKFEEVNSIIKSIKEIATQIGNTEIVELANKVSL